MATKSNQQIRDEYAQRPALSQIGIAADDLVRIAASGLTGGLVDRLQGADQVERTREAQVRAGVAGDVANVAGMALGLKGAGAAISGARALPTAVSAARSAGVGQGLRVLTGTAGPGLVPVAAGPLISRGAAAKGAGAAALLGFSAATRQGDPGAPAPAPATQAQAASQSLSSGRSATSTITPQDRAMAAIDTILRGPFTMREFRDATGALPTVSAAGAKQSDKDKLFGKVSGLADVLYAADLAAADKLVGDARDEARLAATERYRTNLMQPLGIDPSKQAMADAIAAAQEAGG